MDRKKEGGGGVSLPNDSLENLVESDNQLRSAIEEQKITYARYVAGLVSQWNNASTSEQEQLIEKLARVWVHEERFGSKSAEITVPLLRQVDNDFAQRLNQMVKAIRKSEKKAGRGGPLRVEDTDDLNLQAVARARDERLAAAERKVAAVEELARIMLEAWDLTDNLTESARDNRVQEWAEMMVITEKHGGDNTDLLKILKERDADFAAIITTALIAARKREKGTRN